LRIDPLRIIGSATIAIVALLLLILLQQGFTPFEFCQFNVEETLIPVGGDIGRETGRVLWGDRQLDMIAMGFLLFVTATGCTSVLRFEREDTS
jgi:hypothetical protein